MGDSEKTTIQISKESLARLREMAESEYRSASAHADWLIDKAYETYRLEKQSQPVAEK